MVVGGPRPDGCRRSEAGSALARSPAASASRQGRGGAALAVPSGVGPLRTDRDSDLRYPSDFRHPRSDFRGPTSELGGHPRSDLRGRMDAGGPRPDGCRRSEAGSALARSPAASASRQGRGGAALAVPSGVGPLRTDRDSDLRYPSDFRHPRSDFRGPTSELGGHPRSDLRGRMDAGGPQPDGCRRSEAGSALARSPAASASRQGRGGAALAVPSGVGPPRTDRDSDLRYPSDFRHPRSDFRGPTSEVRPRRPDGCRRSEA
jgi:hypothetical protein